MASLFLAMTGVVLFWKFKSLTKSVGFLNVPPFLHKFPAASQSCASALLGKHTPNQEFTVSRSLVQILPSFTREEDFAPG